MAIEADSGGHPMDALDPETSRHPQPGYKALRDVSAIDKRIPDYQVRPGAELAFTNGVRSLDTFPMLLGSSI